ncbi:hypothetical protein B0T24DRAFT_72408 [Lasiosphaeria ovina]|uniref:Uncharacterized protein n=1 Tax=Lasiosphaeria ovina TaxID=92902 RepID=A0AAE0NMF8_9PEZI|nr:hypothetical protein B0T24DRAFT_72408 [Lasiosphaeria ovina]
MPRKKRWRNRPRTGKLESSSDLVRHSPSTEPSNKLEAADSPPMLRLSNVPEIISLVTSDSEGEGEERPNRPPRPVTASQPQSTQPVTQSDRPVMRSDQAHVQHSLKRRVTDSDIGAPPNPTRQKRPKHSSKRVIGFEDVYQGGKAKYKHFIIKYPKKEEVKWYVLRCDPA